MTHYLFTIALLPPAVFALFWAVKRKKHTGMAAGFWFDMFLVTLGVCALLAALAYPDSAASFLFLVCAALVFAFLLLFGVYILLGLLLWNTVQMLKRERPSLKHMLTLILALAILALVALPWVLGKSGLFPWLYPLWMALLGTAVFFALHSLVFLTAFYVGKWFPPRKRVDYIVVLGSGLIDGKVPPLLAGRVDAALRYAARQKRKTGREPCLIMSGGQEADEPRPEAEAMREYAMEKGYPAELVLAETQSKNTRENFLYSKRVAEAHSEGKPYCCIYATSDYHLLRAGLYAGRAGFSCDGVGGRTAGYYLPNALLREYIAYVVMNKKRYLTIAAVVFALSLTLWGGLALLAWFARML